jgi:hypothetical protein
MPRVIFSYDREPKKENYTSFIRSNFFRFLFFNPPINTARGLDNEMRMTERVRMRLVSVKCKEEFHA